MAEEETATTSTAEVAYGEMDFPEERRVELKAAFNKAAKEGRVEHKDVRCPSVPSLRIALCCRPGHSAYAYTYMVATLTECGCRLATGAQVHVHRRGA